MKRAWINVGVGVGCVGLLFSLLVPMVLKSRENARSLQCKINLKQLGLALHNYHDGSKCLPPGFWSSSGWGWSALILPYRDANPIYSWLNPKKGRLGDWSENPRRGDFVRIPWSFGACSADSPQLERADAIEPVFGYRGKGEETTWDISDRLRVFPKTAIRTSPNAERRPIALSNYVAVYGDSEIDCPLNLGTGLFWQNSSVSFLKGDVTDGTANTLMLGERDGSIHLAGNWAGTSYDENDPDACLDPQFVVDALVDSRPINGLDERCFSSRHGGGAHFLMADGAVKFVNEKCSTTILRRLANRADRIQVGDTDLP